MATRLFWLTVLATSLMSLGGCNPSDTVTIQGCGATFPAPLYQRWFLEYYLQHPEVRVNYQPIGSGAGVQQFEEGLVLFGATDEAVKEAKLKEIAKKISEREGKQVEVLQVPLTSGSVALCYNLPDSPKLQLRRKTYVSILLGKIEYWDDPQIKADNPNVNLPHMKIHFIRRADSSGTTFVFTNHLNSADDRWKKDKGGPGPGKTVPWPVGIGGKGNAGVAALIQQTPGAFGYLETGYAELTHLSMAALENHNGDFVLPTPENSVAGLQEAKFDKVLGAAVPDPKGKNAYPIVSMTWVICRKTYADPRQAEKLKAVFLFCLDATTKGQGQELSSELGYIPLPEKALELARKTVNEIHAE